MATTKFLGASTVKFLGSSTLRFIDQSQTAMPTTIDNDSGPGVFPNVSFSWRSRNLDAATATVYSELNNTAPLLNSVSLASNGTSSTINASGPFDSVLYARAQATGKSMSALYSFDAW
jgi:hypothetical protein